MEKIVEIQGELSGKDKRECPGVKQCKACNIKFDITDKDLEFYEKVSPTFNGKKYNIPTPTLCLEYRQQRRLSHVNSRNLYKRKCDAMDYGKEFDFNKTFFEQFNDLRLEVPTISLSVAGNTNSEYVNWCGWSKNCYLCFHCDKCEDVMYSQDLLNSKFVMDCLFGNNLEFCYECLGVGKNAFDILFSKMVYDNITSSYYCNECIGIKNCFGCIGLKNKQYCILNKQYTKEEYNNLVPKIIEHMKKIGEWGEFFPASMSPFGYNDTVANEYFPITPLSPYLIRYDHGPSPYRRGK